jgi:predicted metalloprotease with PDZ domain
VTGSTSPGIQPRSPAPSPVPPSQPASTTAPHLDPATNSALAHVFERLAQARERAELDAQQAKFDLEKAHLQHEHERQLAARGAAERALAKQEAHQTTVAVGGTAATAVLAGAATLALQQPENRRTAQAVMSIGGGALTAAAALADEGSTTRKVLMTAGLVTAGVAAFDYLRQVFSESRGGIGVTFHDRQDALVIKTVRPLSAAAVSGLIAGDELVEVDGLPVAQLGRSEAIRRLRGPIGSPIALGVRRPTTSNFEWKLTLIRTPL